VSAAPRRINAPAWSPAWSCSGCGRTGATAMARADLDILWLMPGPGGPVERAVLPGVRPSRAGRRRGVRAVRGRAAAVRGAGGRGRAGRGGGAGVVGGGRVAVGRAGVPGLCRRPRAMTRLDGDLRAVAVARLWQRRAGELSGAEVRSVARELGVGERKRSTNRARQRRIHAVAPEQPAAPPFTALRISRCSSSIRSSPRVLLVKCSSTGAAMMSCPRRAEATAGRAISPNGRPDRRELCRPGVGGG
jgi:hypothetical protein